MNSRFATVVLACGWMAVAAGGLLAQDAPTGDIDAKGIAALVEQLDSDSFQDRETAMRKLMALGAKAKDAIAKAAEDPRLEMTNRAMEVLKHWFKSSDEAAKQAAKVALNELAKSKNASAARRAQAVLAPAEAIPNNPNFAPPALPAVPLPIPIQGRVMRVQARAGNGEKHVEVERDGKKYKIDETKEGITVTITETIDGKEKSSTFKAKNADELKKAHPEAHKIFEEFGKQAGGAIIGNGRVQIQIQAQAPAILPVNPPVPAPAVEPNLEKFDGLQKELEGAIDRLRKISALPSPKPEDFKQAIEQLESLKKQMQELRPQLSPRLKLEEMRKNAEEAKKKLGALPGARAVPIQAVPVQAVPIQAVPIEIEVQAVEDVPAQPIPVRKPIEPKK